MPPETPLTPGQTGSTTGGDKGQASTADVNARAGDAPLSTPTPNDAFFEQMTSRFRQEISPVVERITKLENALNGGTRVKGKAAGDKSSQADTSQSQGDGNSDATQEELRKLRGELEVLSQKDTERAKAEEASQLVKALDQAIEAGGYARPEIIKDLMLPHLRRGQTGTPLYDRDGKVLSIEDALKTRFAADPAFLKASATQGTNVARGERAGVTIDGKKATVADIKAVKPGTPEFKKMKEEVRRRGR